MLGLWKTEHSKDINILQIGFIMEFTLRNSNRNIKKMARIVDNQNIGDPKYKNMSDNFEKSLAFLLRVISSLRVNSALRIHGTSFT